VTDGPVAEQGASVYPGHRVLAAFPFFDEIDKLRLLAPKFAPGLVDEVLGVDDGSTDGGPEYLRARNIRVISQDHLGVGAALKNAVRYARSHGFSVIVIMAGNNKDDPAEIPRLMKGILEGADYVQGSRFLPGGASDNLPLFRRVAIKLLSILFTIYARKRCTDLTNGFRAYRLSLLDDPRINIEQEWLDNYEYEYYVHWKAYRLGYEVREVAVSKIYPSEKGVQYSKIPPIRGWWRMLRPFLLLSLRLKKRRE
jgi:dolichol-phosphate mannosyltransferase